MKLKSLRRGMAVLLSAVMIASGVSVYAAEGTEQFQPTQEETTVSAESSEEGGAGLSVESASTEETETMEKSTSAAETSPSEEETTEEVTTEEETTEETATEEETTEEAETEKETTKEAATEKETTEEVTTEEVQKEDIILLAKDDSDDSGDEVQIVTNLRWSDETPGEAVFYNPNEENVSFVLHYFKDGQHISTWRTSSSQAGDVTLPIYGYIFESATYTFQVETFAYGVEQDYDLSSGYVSEVSSEFVYTRPSEQVAVPENIAWDSTTSVSWDAVEHAKSYCMDLCRADESAPSGYVLVDGIGGWSRTSIDYSYILASGYDYYVRVRAVSENINVYANGDFSDYIAFDNSNALEGVNDKLDNAIANVTPETVNTVVSTVKDAFADGTAKGELRVAMQTDSKTQEKIEKLENLYKESMGLETVVNPSEDTGIDASSVKLLGAALNATESGSVTFNMTKPDEDTQKDLITNSRFTKAIVLDLGLEGAGINKGETLAIPVTVTMAAPADLDISLLAILHYNTDGTYETLPVRKNADGTISFTVTHFSNFVFGEKEAPSEPEQPDISYSGSDSSSITVSVPSWKPKTEDEIKRYAFFGKEKVNYVADVTNAYPVTIVNAMQGKLCFDVFETVLSDYSIGRTYNIFPAKKAAYDLYKMDTTARITLTIPKELQALNREYKMICVTKGGTSVILDDLDADPDTITFETDTYYAFALVYKDVSVLE